MDLVGTCPKHFWNEWLEEGDLAGEPESGCEYGWRTRSPLAARLILHHPLKDCRLYIVAHGRLRGYAPILEGRAMTDHWAIIRKGGAVASTLPETIPGFQGLRRRWWNRTDEVPFPEWIQP